MLLRRNIINRFWPAEESAGPPRKGEKTENAGLHHGTSRVDVLFLDPGLQTWIK